MQRGGRSVGFEELRRNWRVLPPCLAGITLCSVHAYSLGIMMVPLEREFGWARAEISGGMFILSMIALFVAPLSGLAVDRWGARPIALLGILFYCGALALLSTATPDITSWWLLWVLVAGGNMMLLPTIWTKAINSQFDANRGIALAICLCGSGVAATFVPSLTNLLIADLGWRHAYVALGLIGVAFAFPLTWWLFRWDDPSRPAAGAGSRAATPVEATGVSVRKGFTMPSFLKMAAAILLFSVAICALTTNAVPVLLSRGLTPANAAALAGLLGIGSITGRIVGGLLLDRFDAGKVAAASVALPVAAVLLLLASSGQAAAGAACLLIGLSVGTEVDCCAYLAGRHFGLRSFGVLFGTLNGLMLFGSGIAPVLANHVYDVTASYDLVLWVQIPACLGASLLFLLLGPYPRFGEPERTPGVSSIAPHTAAA